MKHQRLRPAKRSIPAGRSTQGTRRCLAKVAGRLSGRVCNRGGPASRLTFTPIHLAHAASRVVSYDCLMSTPILATKLYVPPPRPNAVLRPCLIERLDEGLREQADPRVRPGRLRQDHDGQRVGGRLQPSRTGGSSRLALPGRRGRRSGALPGLPRRRSADGCGGCRARGAGHAPVSPAATDRIDADGPAQRDRDSPARRRPRPRRLPSRRLRTGGRSCSRSCWSICRRSCTWSSPPGRIRVCPWPGGVLGAS